MVEHGNPISFRLSAMRFRLLVPPVCFCSTLVILCFTRGECSRHTWLLLDLALAFPVFGALASDAVYGGNHMPPLLSVFYIEAWYLTSAFASTLLFCISSLHRLSGFPGPFTWRVSELAQVWNNRFFQAYEGLPSLHKRYGELVRTGECQ